MIGVFDSGLGGLTALKELSALLPNEDFLYRADTAHLPYGEKSRGELCRFSARATAFLRERGADEVLFACGTASSLAFDFCKRYFTFPLYDVVTPSVIKAASLSKSRRIGVAATRATVESGTLRHLFGKYAPDCALFEVCCPSLVSLCESGGESDVACYDAVCTSLLPLKAHKIDTLILGCTHFALLKSAIAALFPSVSLVESGKEGALALAEAKGGASLARPSREGRIRLFSTKDEQALGARASLLLGRRLRAEKIDQDII